MSEAVGSSDTSPVNEVTSLPRSDFELERERSFERPREKWSFNLEFIVAAVCLSGFVNVWRLHYLMYKYGGVVFLLQYINFLLLFGVPLFYLETCLGQFWGKGPFHIWKFCPIFRGVGLSLIVANFLYLLYFGLPLAMFMYYAAMSFSSELLWISCPSVWYYGRCFDRYNVSLQEYITNVSPGLDDVGVVRPELVACMAAVCLLMCAVLCWGVKISGKVVLASFPLGILLMLILLMRGLTTPGAATGIGMLLLPNFHPLAKFESWKDAFLQALYTVVNQAVIPTLSSYNHFNAPCLRNTFTVIGLTIIFGLVFSIMMMSHIGAFAYSTGVSVEIAINYGLSFMFVFGAEMFSRFSVPEFWCFIFFFMLFLFGFTRQFLSVEVLITMVMDIIPRPSRVKRIIVTLGVCGLIFLLTIPFLTQGGMHLFYIFDVYTWKIVQYAFCVLECGTVAWFYGLNQFSEEIKMMTGLRPPVIFKFVWAILIPPVMMSVFVYEEVNFYPLHQWTFSNFPDYADKVGYFLATVSLFPIPIYVVYWFIRSPRNTPPFNPDNDCKPANSAWATYDVKQGAMDRTLKRNFGAIFKS